jgi:hypothetical protein
VTLLVRADGSEFARLVTVIDVPVSVDTAPDAMGHRYERAVRRFGRVWLVAYRELSGERVA